MAKSDACINCRFSREFIIPQALQKGYTCHRFPASIPMPGLGGQNIIFVHPALAATEWCGEHQPKPVEDSTERTRIPLVS